jgi:hypothetical protein
MPTTALPPCKAPGSGLIHATSVPYNGLRRVDFVYPLKLIPSRSSKCITVFLLSYGGGLVAGDAINLDIYVDPITRLCLLTQGNNSLPSFLSSILNILRVHKDLQISFPNNLSNPHDSPLPWQLLPPPPGPTPTSCNLSVYTNATVLPTTRRFGKLAPAGLDDRGPLSDG